jgi:hypothetical protein
MSEIPCACAEKHNRDRIFKLLRSPGINLKESIPPVYVACGGILEQSLKARLGTEQE